jgi:hypothetical protein
MPEQALLSRRSAELAGVRVGRAGRSRNRDYDEGFAPPTAIPRIVENGWVLP